LLESGYCPQSSEIGTGGPIITIDDKNPTAEALAVIGGKIVAIGNKDDVLKLKGDKTLVIDLGGKSLIPGMIDGHSHFFQAAQIADYVNVSAPPVGTATSIAEIVALLKDRVSKRPLQKGEWLMGYGYDRDPLMDGRDMTRDDLDKDFRRLRTAQADGQAKPGEF
jgi:hypothetical protein